MIKLLRRYAPHLGALAALAVFIVFVAYSGIVDVRILPSSFTAIVQAPGTASTTVSSTNPADTGTQQSHQLSAEETRAALATSASTLRRALVNIICTAPPKSGLHSISGSGVVVSPTGMIVTNAHIAQYFLLTNRGVTCEVRTGSPAVSTYRASLVYIPHKWIEQNAALLTQETPVGTGERDFALLAITGYTQAASAPVIAATPFPYVSLAPTAPSARQPVAIVTYGAQFLTADQVKTALYPTIVFSAVQSVLTFTTTTPDVLAFGGSVAAQEGSSGGGVVDTRGALVGVVTTSSVMGAVADRYLGAITSEYIRAAYLSEAGESLKTLLARSTAVAIANFTPQIEPLRAILEKAIAK